MGLHYVDERDRAAAGFIIGLVTELLFVAFPGPAGLLVGGGLVGACFVKWRFLLCNRAGLGGIFTGLLIFTAALKFQQLFFVSSLD